MFGKCSVICKLLSHIDAGAHVIASVNVKANLRVPCNIFAFSPTCVEKVHVEMMAVGMLGAHMHRALLRSQFRRVRYIASKTEQLSAIKALREQSGAPMSDVKSALVDADWHPGAQLSLSTHIVHMQQCSLSHSPPPPHTLTPTHACKHAHVALRGLLT